MVSLVYCCIYNLRDVNVPLRKELLMADKEAEILKALAKAGKPLKPGDIAEMSGIDKAEVSKALASMKKQGKVRSPKMCFYEPV